MFQNFLQSLNQAKQKNHCANLGEMIKYNKTVTLVTIMLLYYSSVASQCSAMKLCIGDVVDHKTKQCAVKIFDFLRISANSFSTKLKFQSLQSMSSQQMVSSCYERFLR